jgi:hypothetical protein
MEAVVNPNLPPVVSAVAAFVKSSSVQPGFGSAMFAALKLFRF